MINLVFGCAGSGKTRYMTQRINESVSLGRRTYLLVPEQQVFTAEAMLANMPASSGLFFEIISFSRLCELVFGKFGGLTYSAASGGITSSGGWLESAYAEWRAVEGADGYNGYVTKNGSSVIANISPMPDPELWFETLLARQKRNG